MNKNDAKIKELLKKVEDQKAGLGVKPRISLITNGVLSGVNLNTQNRTGLITVYSELIQHTEAFNQAIQELGEPTEEYKVGGYTVSEWKQDIKNRIEYLRWSEKKAKLDKTEAQLKALVSEELRSEGALADLEKDLG